MSSPKSPHESIPGLFARPVAGFFTSGGRAMSWNEAIEQADKIGIEGATPHRVRRWANAIRFELGCDLWGDE